MTYLHGLHDMGGEGLMVGSPGWVVVTEAIGSNPNDMSGRDYRHLVPNQIIVRLNNGYGSVGTIPLASEYDNFAQRCANFVNRSQGCHRWIIGNEPNLSIERPQGVMISPEYYAHCYKLCLDKIQNLVQGQRVIVAPVGPWNVQSGPWLDYMNQVLTLLQSSEVGGIAIHTYTHGTDPALISSEAKMNPPYENCYYHFRAYRDLLGAVPSSLRHLPVYLTETDQNDPWADTNSGWIVRAMEEIDNWNKTEGTQKIFCVCCYRWSSDDRWSINNKAGVIEDFKTAVAKQYPSKEENMTTGPTPLPVPGEVEWDPRLTVRGAEIKPASPSPVQNYWKCIKGLWYNKDESQGRHNVFVDCVDGNGVRILGVNVKFYWSSGSDAKPTENKVDPWMPQGYGVDFPFNSPAPSYGIKVLDSIPSDDVWGLGYGDENNPKSHTSAYLVFQRVQAGTNPSPNPIPIPTPPIATTLAKPVQAPYTISQHFYQNPQDYARFGLVGHNGLDIAAPEGTPVFAIADGLVAYIGVDTDYGNYIRIWHPQLLVHSFYAHLKEPPHTSLGAVKAGAQIGLMGSTGNATGPHLHLEVRLAVAGGDYSTISPMPKGRCDPETFLCERGLQI